MAKLSDGFIEEIKDRIEKVRKAIKIEETVEALQACVAGTQELSKEQIAAAKILLSKVLPDLKAVEHIGLGKQSDITDEPMSADDWERQYTNRTN